MSDYKYCHLNPFDPTGGQKDVVVEKVWLHFENGSAIALYDKNANPPILGASTRRIMALDTPITFELDDQATAALERVNRDMNALSLSLLAIAGREGKYGYWGKQFAKLYNKASNGSLNTRQKSRLRMAHKNCLDLDIKRMYSNYSPGSRMYPNGYKHVQPPEGLNPPGTTLWATNRAFPRILR
jgi:hypothetical protein